MASKFTKYYLIRIGINTELFKVKSQKSNCSQWIRVIFKLHTHVI